jgi:hypothetical protein
MSWNLYRESRSSRPRMLMFDHIGMLPCLLVCSELAERFYIENLDNISNLCISADVEVDTDDAFAETLWYVNSHAVSGPPKHYNRRACADLVHCTGTTTSSKSIEHLYRPANTIDHSTPNPKTKMPSIGCTTTLACSSVFPRRSSLTRMRRRTIGVLGGRFLDGMMRFVLSSISAVEQSYTWCAWLYRSGQMERQPATILR